jgi:hypothetical protein
VTLRGAAERFTRARSEVRVLLRPQPQVRAPVGAPRGPSRRSSPRQLRESSVRGVARDLGSLAESWSLSLGRCGQLAHGAHERPTVPEEDAPVLPDDELKGLPGVWV